MFSSPKFSSTGFVILSAVMLATSNAQFFGMSPMAMGGMGMSMMGMPGGGMYGSSMGFPGGYGAYPGYSSFMGPMADALYSGMGTGMMSGMGTGMMPNYMGYGGYPGMGYSHGSMMGGGSADSGSSQSGRAFGSVGYRGCNNCNGLGYKGSHGCAGAGCTDRSSSQKSSYGGLTQAAKS